jgi:hypothetical protein
MDKVEGELIPLHILNARKPEEIAADQVKMETKLLEEHPVKFWIDRMATAMLPASDISVVNDEHGLVAEPVNGAAGRPTLINVKGLEMNRSYVIYVSVKRYHTDICNTMRIAHHTDETAPPAPPDFPSLPAILATVKSIKTAQMDEVSSLLRPPKIVAMTLESVSIILFGVKKKNSSDLTWKEIAKLYKDRHIIDDIATFQTAALEKRSFDLLERYYITRKEFTAEKVARANKACVSLFNWVQAQYAYCKQLNTYREYYGDKALDRYFKKVRRCCVCVCIGSCAMISAM